MKLIDRKKLATIMTLTSFLGSKSSAVNTGKNMRGAVYSNSESPYNNQPKLGIKKSLNDSSKKLSNIATYGILASIGAVAAGLGALGYHVAGLLFGNRNTKSASPEESALYEEFMKYLKGKSVIGITLDNMGIVKFYGPYGNIGTTGLVETVKSENPGIEGKKLIDSTVAFGRYWNSNFDYYQLYLRDNVAAIALKHGLILNGICDESFGDLVNIAEKLKGYCKCEILINIAYKDKKKIIKIFSIDSNDLTQEYNKDNPTTDLDKQKKGFYDDLVKFINNDDFIRKLFLE